MSNMLAPILESTRERITRLPGLADLKARCADAPAVRDFAEALSGPGLGVVAEVKRRSPSRGPLAMDLDPVERAEAYSRGGASAVSVLTEPHHFSGSDDDLVAVRASVGIPVLRKDFTLDPRQIWEARAIGADAVLLIVAALDDRDLVELHETAAEVGVAALVEVHNEPEAERALEAGASIVGVNNRDLTTFHVDLATSERLAPLLAGCRIRIAESGILSPADAARMAAVGYDAVLVGESLVKSGDAAAAVAAIRGL